MSLRFVCGRAGTGKTRFCLAEIKAKIEEQTTDPLVLLVPEQFSFQAEKELVAMSKNKGILKTEVLSFQRMAFRIFNEVGGITYPHIHSSGKCMIIYRILEKMKDRLKIFALSSNREGFVNTISDLITEFKRYNVTPDQLDMISRELPEENMLRDKLNELFIIYGEYEKVISERYRDSDDDLTLASRKLSESNLYNNAEIWIDGFTNFTPQEYKMIGELLKKSKRVTVCLSADLQDGEVLSNGVDVFAPVKKAYKKLTNIAEANGIKIEKTVFLSGNPPARFRNSPELAHLERNYYSYPHQKYSGNTSDISLYAALNIFSEVEATARDIISLCRDKKMRFKDIAVVSGNLTGYEKPIEVIFSDYGIPCFIDRKTEISSNPIVRLILSMLEIITDNWSYEAVFGYLKTGLTGISREDIDKIENYVLACGIRGSHWTSEKDWQMVPDLIPDEKVLEKHKPELESINNIRRRITEPIVEFRNRTKGRRSAADFCEGLFDFLVRIRVPETIEQRINEFNENGELALANEYSQVWNIIMEVFDQMVEVMGNETFGVERFSRILKIGLGEYKIGLIPASLDRVLIGSVDRSKSHQIKALFILGVNDGVLPPVAMKEGILSDDDRVALDHLGLELAGDTRSQTFDQQFLIYRVLTTPESYLRISWPIADAEGRAMRPSTIISRIRRIFPGINERGGIIPPKNIEEELEMVAAKEPTFKHTITALRRKADQDEISALWENAWRWFFSQIQWGQKCHLARRAFEFKNLAQNIQEDRIRALYGDPAVTSVSRLEKYTFCPFSFFVQYGLGAKERKIYRLSPPDIGTFMHVVIERFSKLVSKEETTWRSFDREWCNQKVAEIVEEMLQRMQGSGISASTRYRTLATRLKRVVARAIWVIAQHIRRSSFNPIEYEVGFGEGEKYPPITIELDSGQKIQLTGRIDRVDALKTEKDTYLRIIDYKSGTKDFRLSDVFYGLQIQLITYLDALWESNEDNSDGGIYPAGMLYFKVDDPIIRGNPDQTEEEIEAALLKQLKMKGLLLADVKLIKCMDNTIEGASMIIPATLNKGDVLGKNTSGATLEQFKLLRGYVKKLLKGICSEIMKGNVDIRPYKKKSTTSCKYCSFLPICQFDTSMKENRYRLLYDIDNGEVWDLIEVENQ